jgi:hypothetical protein
MSIAKKFSSRGATALQLHMAARSGKVDDSSGPMSGAGKSAAQATFGPATYYRLGVLTPGGPTKRSGSGSR